MAKQAHLPDGTILEFPDSTNDAVIDRIVKEHISSSNSNPVMNAVRGFAARGNQAITALNPLASQESKDRVAGEQEWVRQHKGAGVGSMLADLAITAPAGIGASAPLRALYTGAIEGSTQSSGYGDKLKDFALGTIGAGIGEGAGTALGYLAQPFRSVETAISPFLKRKAKEIGLKLNAAQETGNKALIYADSALDKIPSSSVSQQEFKNAQRETWQKALLERAGSTESSPTTQAMGDIKDRLSAVYKDVSSRNNINVDQAFKNALNDVQENLLGRIPTNQKGIVKSYLKDFNTAPVGAQISGSQYQEIRSMLDKQARGFKNSDPATAEALKSIRAAADAAMERSVSPADKALWRQNNKEYAVMKAIEEAVDPVTASIVPGKFINRMTTRDKNRVMYGKGEQDLSDIGKVGHTFISSKAADSGTAQTAAMIKLLTGATAAGYGADLAYNHDPIGAAGGAGISLLAALLTPKLAAKAIQNGSGYLSKGLADMNKQVVPGLTRRRGIFDDNRQRDYTKQRISE